MISISTKQRLQEILTRLSRGELVSFNERVELRDFADRDPMVARWLNRAKRLQNNEKPKDSIDNLLNDLDIGLCEPDDSFNNDEDDLWDWFKGAPSWLGRS